MYRKIALHIHIQRVQAISNNSQTCARNIATVWADLYSKYTSSEQAALNIRKWRTQEKEEEEEG